MEKSGFTIELRVGLRQRRKNDMRMIPAYNYIAEYQLHYYPEWCATLKEQPSDPDIATA